MAALSLPASFNQGAAPLIAQAAMPCCVLTRLRLETRGEHDAVERVLDLMGTGLTREIYCRRLERFYGFYGPLEDALQIRCELPDDHGGGPTSQLATLLPRLKKTAHLQRDLHYLGVETADLLLCSNLPPLETEAQVLGCLYVIEGATLGGQMITRHVRGTLGITPSTGGSFFEGYAGDTGKMWQAMRQLLVSGAIDRQTESAMVANAIVTFARLRGWCDPADTCAKNGQKNHREAKQRA